MPEASIHSEALLCTLRLSDVPTHNRIVCVRTMRNEFMTHRTLPLGSEGRWQCENLPVLGSGWKDQVMSCNSDDLNYRQQGEASYYGQAVKLESHNRL